MLSALMCERKLLFHSNHPELLAPASDVILALLYPLQWQCLYVPVLPAGIASDCLQAPVPFVYGMITTELDDVMDTMKTRGTELDLDDVLFVNIDTGFAALGYGTGHHQAAEFHAIDPLPSPLVLQFQVNLAEMDAMFQLPSLCSRMHHGHDGGGHSADGHAGAVIMSTLDATEDVQAVFCSFYAMLLEGYRNCLYFPHQSSLPSFSVQRFLFVQQSASYPFFIKFFQSQVWSLFLPAVPFTPTDVSCFRRCLPRFWRVTRLLRCRCSMRSVRWFPNCETPVVQCPCFIFGNPPNQSSLPEFRNPCSQSACRTQLRTP